MEDTSKKIDLAIQELGQFLLEISEHRLTVIGGIKYIDIDDLERIKNNILNFTRMATNNTEEDDGDADDIITKNKYEEIVGWPKSKGFRAAKKLPTRFLIAARNTNFAEDYPTIRIQEIFYIAIECGINESKLSLFLRDKRNLCPSFQRFRELSTTKEIEDSWVSWLKNAKGKHDHIGKTCVDANCNKLEEPNHPWRNNNIGKYKMDMSLVEVG